MGPYFQDAALYLVRILFGLGTTVLMLRTMLQLVRANFFNPICQSIVKVSNPVLVPLRRILPNWRNLDVPAMVFMLLLKCIELIVILSILGRQGSALAIVATALVSLIDFAIMTLLVVILIRIVIGWISPYSTHPINGLLGQLSEPLLGPARRTLPPFEGLDFSPLVVSIGLVLSRKLLIAPLLALASSL